LLGHQESRDASESLSNQVKDGLHGKQGQSRMSGLREISGDSCCSGPKFTDGA
jgi:hypothetical protein